MAGDLEIMKTQPFWGLVNLEILNKLQILRTSQPGNTEKHNNNFGAAGGRLGKKPFLKPVPGKNHIEILENTSKQTLFWKWLRRPNHYAHLKDIEILCKTPVSMHQELPPGLISIRTNSKYSSPARMSTWISRWRRRRRRRRADNFSIWPEP